MPYLPSLRSMYLPCVSLAAHPVPHLLALCPHVAACPPVSRDPVVSANQPDSFYKPCPMSWKHTPAMAGERCVIDKVMLTCECEIVWARCGKMWRAGRHILLCISHELLSHCFHHLRHHLIQQALITLTSPAL